MEPGTIADRSWHFDKSISVGHMISTLTLAGALLGFVFSANTKVETLAIRMSGLESRLEREMVRHTQDVALIRDQLHRMESKLDRVIEREQDR